MVTNTIANRRRVFSDCRAASCWISAITFACSDSSRGSADSSNKVAILFLLCAEESSGWCIHHGLRGGEAGRGREKSGEELVPARRPSRRIKEGKRFGQQVYPQSFGVLDVWRLLSKKKKRRNGREEREFQAEARMPTAADTGWRGSIWRIFEATAGFAELARWKHPLALPDMPRRAWLRPRDGVLPKFALISSCSEKKKARAEERHLPRNFHPLRIFLNPGFSVHNGLITQPYEREN